MANTTDTVTIIRLIIRLAKERVNLKAISRIAEYRSSNNKRQGYADANADWQEAINDIIKTL